MVSIDEHDLLLARGIAVIERAPRRAAQLLGRATPRLPQIWHELAYAWALLSWERFDRAHALFQAAQRHSAAVAQRYTRYGLLLVAQRRLARPGLDVEFATMASEGAAAGDTWLVARARLDLARQLNVLGRPLEALQLIASLEAEGSPLADPLERARLLRVRGVATYALGEYAAAEDLLTTAERHFVAGRQPIEVARCWMERATVALYQERLDDAIQLYTLAAQRFRAADLPLQQAFCRKGLGAARLMQGHYDAALANTQQALALFQRLGRRPDGASCTLNLGNIYYRVGRWEAAEAAYRQAERVFTDNATQGQQLLAQRNLAMVLARRGAAQAATKLLANLEQRTAALGHHSETAEVWCVQAALLSAEHPQLAAERYMRAHRRFANLGNHAAAGECRLECGWLALDQGATAVAVEHFAAAGPPLHRHPHHTWRVQHGLARCAESAGDDRTALEHYVKACDIVATLRYRLASTHASSALAQQADRLYAEAFALAMRLDNYSAALLLLEGHRALALRRGLVAQAYALPTTSQAELDALHDKLRELIDQPAADTELAATLDQYGDMFLRLRHDGLPTDMPNDALPPFALERTRQLLTESFGSDWVVLAYDINDQQLTVFSLDAQTLRGETIALSPTLDHALTRATQRVYQTYLFNDIPYLQKRTAIPWAIPRLLADALIPADVRDRLTPETRLLIVPSGRLHGLPWPLLRLDDHWLAECAVIQVLPSLSMLESFARPSRTGAALLIGCEQFGERAVALPGVGVELDLVRELWPGAVECLQNEQATRTQLTDALSRAARTGGVGVLHIASHAQMLRQRGMLAHIKLWDGHLLAAEISALDLRGALVLLTACDGAVADVWPGEELISLNWAMLAAGANTVLSNLWPTYDQMVHGLVRELYAALAQHNDLALALASAQRAMINGAGPVGTTAPTFWGGFLVSGGAGLRYD